MPGGEVFAYVRHKPEQTLLYQLIERHWPEFQSHLSEVGSYLPRHVTREFNEYLVCGRLEHGFLRVRCEDCHHEHLVAFSCKRRGFCPSCGARRMVETAALLVDDVLPHKPIRQWVLSFPYPLRFLLANNPQVVSKALSIINRVISAYLINKAGCKKSRAYTGAVTLVQRFGSALNLNLHFHILFIEGVYQEKYNGQLRFHHVNAPTVSELNTLVATISQRIARNLERQGLLTQDDTSSYLTLDLQDDDAMNQLQGHSITYRIAVGPQQGRKVFALQTIPSWEDDDFGTNQVGKIAGFSLHAGVATKTRERNKLERLCRYIARPGVSEKRLAVTSRGMVRYELKTPYRDGTTHVIFEPLDFIAKLAALVPKPRANLTRFHGVLAPNSKYRIHVTPAKRGKGSANLDLKSKKNAEPTVSGHKEMTWAQRLKRVFNIDITICNRCSGAVKIIACIEDPLVIKKILDHLDAKSRALASANQLPEPRAPPQARLFD
ncbi:MAG: IS91 family transposase [Proteobacteria bacterium]|nr:IS91 family transposase [Pseudomonadota bacterium]